MNVIEIILDEETNNKKEISLNELKSLVNKIGNQITETENDNNLGFITSNKDTKDVYNDSNNFLRENPYNKSKNGSKKTSSNNIEIKKFNKLFSRRRNLLNDLEENKNLENNIENTKDKELISFEDLKALINQVGRAFHVAIYDCKEDDNSGKNINIEYNVKNDKNSIISEEKYGKSYASYNSSDNNIHGNDNNNKNFDYKYEDINDDNKYHNKSKDIMDKKYYSKNDKDNYKYKYKSYYSSRSRSKSRSHSRSKSRSHSRSRYHSNYSSKRSRSHSRSRHHSRSGHHSRYSRSRSRSRSRSYSRSPSRKISKSSLFKKNKNNMDSSNLKETARLNKVFSKTRKLDNESSLIEKDYGILNSILIDDDEKDEKTSKPIKDNDIFESNNDKNNLKENNNNNQNNSDINKVDDDDDLPEYDDLV
ncbi:hypothetical protein BCR32DRAFT_294838 [Anaeromyces robustus]|uniref:Uncharacterized protein n=1 Tax=Anaeromyces robustus TaxID=1754192 RepID=A0A1Y1X0B6_9FUNG|nr:hypothetical protein BCR32DRAFT_294838 [Anaeromyces robustus]|eukprot:ORX78784.1 hypothetical protein BCR32DRAFT_294838 [Anaeromyces robustus]